MTHEVTIRPARAEEAAALTDLALRSKSHWGYDAEFLAACRAELTIRPDECASGAIRIAVRGSKLLGFHCLRGTPPHGELASLFVDLDAIGRGIGGLLLKDALTEAAARGFDDLTLEADPGAEPFYAHYGAVRIGETASGSIAGRVLPRMRFMLTSMRDPRES
ncbi:GNAT family N-acetyltransferase [Micropruina sp.]|uniref:GNAT family N-acetyltransferase n=1 Tax=Micropruina sp. TaxID=2737536 RepID=UPI0026130EA6|nr:GNAT family N-acetyltransferase [Micropruina sp.]